MRKLGVAALVAAALIAACGADAKPVTGSGSAHTAAGDTGGAATVEPAPQSDPPTSRAGSTNASAPIQAAPGDGSDDELPAPRSLANTVLRLVTVAEIPDPIAMATNPDTAQRYVASRSGQVWLLDPGGSDTAPRLVADVGDSVSGGCERGLLGLAFAPDGSQLYLSYTDTSGASRIAAAPMQDSLPETDRMRVLLRVEQPACNHNGGHVAIGPDGLLWAGFGDGGAADDLFGNGQDPTTLLGTIVRIDPMPPTGRGYAIPAGNPFAGGGGAAEVWAYGARNPWRFSFDSTTGDLWIGDVGQNAIEEIHVLRAADGWSPGANLGWPLFEGDARFAGSAAPSDLVFPAYTYGHDEGCSVTGGEVYRGARIGPLAGVYVFGDYCTGEMWGLVADADGTLERVSLGASVPRQTLVSFGTDADGELYVLSSAGTVFRLESDVR